MKISTWWCAVGAVCTLSCGASKDDPRYTPADDGRPPCMADSDCDDGSFCNGDEACLPADPRANRRGCVRPLPFRHCATGTSCDEGSKSCVGPTDCTNPDADSDGHRSIACGGDDCDDSDPNRYPGKQEICDPANHDEDCDPTTFSDLRSGDGDLDGDGYISAGCCNSDPGGGMNCGDDCNDNNPSMHPGLPEVCDGIDNDCNGLTDEGVQVMLFPDRDHDGYGDATPDAGRLGCLGLAGYSPLANDCDDSNAAMVPGAMKCEVNSPLNNGVLECDADSGVYLKTGCPNQGLCHPQPNGTGVCF